MQEICTHCASPITHTRLHDQSGIYCCHSCQTVAEILRSEELDENYRHLMDLSGAKPRKLGGNVESLIQSLSANDQWKELGTWKADLHCLELSSPQIHCAACGWLLERALALEGVKHLRVHFSMGQLDLHYDPNTISLETLLRRAYHYGYQLLPLEHAEKDPSESMEKALLYRLAVAGFAMMNVATFSFSAYEEHFSSVQQWTPLMNLWALLLTIPVLLYSATPFYQKAIAGLRAGILHMDLPVSVGILFSFVASVLLWWNDRPAYFDTASGVIFFLLLGRWWVQRFERGLISRGEWMGKLLPSQIQRIHAHGLELCAPSQLLLGEKFSLKAGEMLPLRAKILGESNREFDPQWMTGESRLCRFEAGSVVPSGYLCTEETVFEALELYRDSEFYQLRKKWRSIEKQKSANKAEKLVPYFTASILVIALIAGVMGLQKDWIHAFEQASLVLILSCPCALALSRPISEGLSLGLARKSGYLLRSSQTLDELAQIDVVVLDKTGTLSAHRRSILDWEWLQESPLHRELLGLCAKQSLHPSSRALAEELNAPAQGEILASAEEEHLGVYAQIQKDHQNYHVWICRAWLKEADFAILGLSPQDYDFRVHEWDSMALVNGKIVALMRFSEEILPGAAQMVQKLTRSGKQVLILSGDRQDRVQKLAAEVGATQAWGALSPFDKAAKIQELKAQGLRVLTAGDGFNDALMLGESHLAALAYGGARSLGGNAEILALRGDWTHFPRLFHLGRDRLRAEWAGYGISLVYNFCALGLALGGFLAPLVGAIAMPLSSLSVGLATWLFLRK